MANVAPTGPVLRRKSLGPVLDRHNIECYFRRQHIGIEIGLENHQPIAHRRRN